MKAAVFQAARQPLEIREYPLLPVEAGMTRLSLLTSGICGTDVHIWDGALGIPGPVILGHEYLGRIEEIGTGDAVDCLGQPLAVGDRAAVNVIESCGCCRLCESGGDASCLHIMDSLTYTKSPEIPPHFHGGYADANYSPTRYLHRLPDTLPTDVAAAFLCAGPTVERGLRYAGGVQPGDHVVVQGAGPVGLYAVLRAKTAGAASVTMIGSGSNPLRLALATRYGADQTLDIRATSIDERREWVLACTGGIGVDLIIEGTGNPEAIPEGLALLRACGRYIWAGQYSDRGSIALPTHLITFNALRIFGSAQFSIDDRARYFTFLETLPKQWDNIRAAITDRCTVTEANVALGRARSGAAVKTLLVGE